MVKKAKKRKKKFNIYDILVIILGIASAGFLIYNYAIGDFLIELAWIVFSGTLAYLVLGRLWENAKK